MEIAFEGSWLAGEGVPEGEGEVEEGFAEEGWLPMTNMDLQGDLDW